MAHLPVDRVHGGSVGLGLFDEFAVVRPVGALAGKVGLCQVAAEDGGGLIADLSRFSDDVWCLR